MAFTESLKKQILEKCHYTCVWCQKPGSLEVHHILPQADGGPDTEDNACPLCPNCHTDLGGNPELRKGLKQRRDWWVKKCKQQSPELAETNRRINELALDFSEHRRDFGEMKEMLALIHQSRSSAIGDARSIGQLVEASGVSLPAVDAAPQPTEFCKFWQKLVTVEFERRSPIGGSERVGARPINCLDRTSECSPLCSFVAMGGAGEYPFETEK